MPTYSNSWSTLGAIAPRDLITARLAAHYAVQPLAAAAYALLPMKEDHSHTNLSWSAEQGGFVGRPLASGVRCFLSVADLRAGLLDENGERAAQLPFHGATLEACFAALAGALREHGEEVPAAGLKLPEYDLPKAPFANGEPLSAPRAELEELGRWFHDGALVLSELAESRLDGAELVMWPHHFDIAALRTFDAGTDPEKARSIGVGLSPGDGSFAEPYFYVSPWPAPPPDALPELPRVVQWHTEGFTSAVLNGTRAVESAPPESQQTTIGDALRAALTASATALGA